MTTHKITLERVVTERVIFALDSGMTVLNTAIVEAYAALSPDFRMIDSKTERDETPWRVIDADPPIASATITVKGAPRGRRKRKPTTTTEIVERPDAPTAPVATPIGDDDRPPRQVHKLAEPFDPVGALAEAGLKR